MIKPKASRLKWQVSVAILLVCALIWGVLRLLAWGQCSWYGYQSARDVRYAAFVGCMVKVGDHWAPRNELRTEQ